MSTLHTTALAAHAHLASSVPASWDLNSLFQNANTYAKVIGGSALMLLGTVALIWGVVKLVKKLFGGQASQQESWLTVVALIIVGGAVATGGFSLASKIGSGGEKTITQLGGGSIVQTYWSSTLDPAGR